MVRLKIFQVNKTLKILIAHRVLFIYFTFFQHSDYATLFCGFFSNTNGQANFPKSNYQGT